MSSVSGTISSPGLGTSLDVNSLVTSLVNAEISPAQTRLIALGNADSAKISALGLITSDLSAVQTSLKAFLTGGALTTLTANSSNSSLFTATALSSAVAGNYQVVVDQLATANSITSGAFANSSAVVGNGTLTIHGGGSSFNVTLADGANTLSDLRDAINKAADNTGVTATIITGTDGAHLLLSATETGASNAVSVDTSALISFTGVSGQDANDAIIHVAGIKYQGSSNTISDAIQGVTLNLVGANSGSTSTLSVAANTGSASSAVQDLISNYNTLLSLLNTDTKYDAETKTAGPMLGNSSIQSLYQKVQSTIGGSIATSVGGINSLSQIGITTNKDGSLSLNSTLFNSVLQSNPDAVQALLSSSTGLGAQLNTSIDGYLGTSGIITAQTDSLQSQIDDLSDKLTKLGQRKSDLTDLYTKQFNSINNVVSKYTNISGFLTQTFNPTKSSSSG
jgi:flagellar hook-associated protein 2